MTLCPSKRRWKGGAFVCRSAVLDFLAGFRLVADDGAG